MRRILPASVSHQKLAIDPPADCSGADLKQFCDLCDREEARRVVVRRTTALVILFVRMVILSKLAQSRS